MTNETLIAEEPGALYRPGTYLEDGVAVIATPENLIARYGAEGGGCCGELAVPWPEILKHAPRVANVYPVAVRPAVIAFASTMEEVLRANDHKGTWHDCSPEYLSRKLTEEFAELQMCLTRRLKENQAFSEFPPHSQVCIEHEAVDVANVCMMIADLCRNPPPTRTT